jgi:PAS domain S-box-containing protein
MAARSAWPTLIVDDTQRIIAASASAIRMLSASAGELLQRPLHTIVSSESWPTLDEMLLQASSPSYGAAGALMLAGVAGTRPVQVALHVLNTPPLIAITLASSAPAERRRQLLARANVLAPQLRASASAYEICATLDEMLRGLDLGAALALLGMPGALHPAFPPLALDAPLSREVLQHNATIFHDQGGDLLAALDLDHAEAVFDHVAAVAAPLRGAAQTYGVLLVWGPGLEPDDALYVEAIAQQAAGAIEQSTLRQAASGPQRNGLAQASPYQAALATHEYAAMVIENVPDALVICDAAMGMHPLNERPLSAIGFTRADLEGRLLTDLVTIQYQPQIAEYWRRVRAGALQRFETMLLRADGSGFHAWVTAAPIPGADDVLAIITDVTARHKLMQAEKMAALGRLVGGVAHELNNPLAVVLGLAQLQLMEQHDLTLQADLQGIERAVLRASSIVQQLRMFVNPQPPFPRALSLPLLIDEAISEHADRLRELHVALNITVEPNMPTLEGDQTLLRQAFINIIDNALLSIERTAYAHHTIDIRIWHDAPSIAVVISDTGSGIAPEHLPHIFEPFFTTRAVGQGTGLGLAVVYTIIQQHSGQIWAENTAAQGATIHIRLPLTQP